MPGANASSHTERSETSIVVGPIRQTLADGETVTVLIANTTGRNVHITTGTALGDTRGVFEDAPAPLKIVPDKFVLRHGEQRSVLVTKTGPITATLAAVVFTVVPNGQAGTGEGATVIVRGQVLAQFTIHPDRLTVTASGSTGTSTQWVLYALMLTLAAFGYRQYTRAKERRRKHKAWTW